MWLKILSFFFLLQVGSASHYSDNLEGNKTYSGDVFHQNLATAAHRTYPMGSIVVVINPRNNKWVIVRINDKMGKSRHIIDLTNYSTKILDFRGATKVQVLRIL